MLSKIEAKQGLRPAATVGAREGSVLEALIFGHRRLILAVSLLLTALLGWSATRITVNASYTAMLPEHQQYVVNYEKNRGAMRALGNAIRIVVENKKGTIYDPGYLAALRSLNDSVFLMPGVDRSYMKSLWTPGVRWTQITEDGAVGGPVMPENFDGSPGAIDRLRQNVQNAGLAGSLVANDEKSSSIVVPLLDIDPTTGKAFDYGAFWSRLSTKIKTLQSPSIQIRTIGFAAVMGNLIAALHEVVGFFGIAALIASIFIFAFTRCLRSTTVILCCSLIAVVWLLGIIRFAGFSLDPYSILVPFLVFAIGVSHGAQKMNGIMQDIGRGAPSLLAARLTFRRLFVAGLTALAADAVGFAVLGVIDIRSIRSLAAAASIGVSVLVFTNLVLLPVLLSYIGVSRKAAIRSLKAQQGQDGHGPLGRIACGLELLCTRRYAIPVAAVAVLLVGAMQWVARDVVIGDVGPGAPELREDSVYNRDNAYVMAHYSLSNDQFAVIVRGPPHGLNDYRSILEMDRLAQKLRKVAGVQAVVSAADYVRLYTTASFEGNLKWWTISRDGAVLGAALNEVFANNPELINADFSAAPVIAFLADHEAATLSRVARVAGTFARDHSTKDESFLLAAGNAGVDAATNIAVSKANELMPYLIYAAVAVLCFVSFRTWRAVVVAIVPLLVTSVLCEALMVVLGIGVKVATLPVIALGVGVGVDYALYLLSVQLAHQRRGDPLRVAYRKALQFTGRIVALVGCTLASGVLLWTLSPIKFQADMGILLTFMFLWNMLSALTLIPVLSYFLLPTERVLASGRGKTGRGWQAHQ